MSSDPTAPPADPRGATELTAGENADLCSGCITCCTYITVEIDAPRSAWEYDQWIWALHHERVSLFLEKPERWFLQFDTRCERLDDRGRCSIYGRHPVLCRSYDPRSCERRLPLGDITATFRTADALETWIRNRRPRHWERLVAYRRANGEQPETSAGLIPVTALMGIAAAPPPRRGRVAARSPH